MGEQLKTGGTIGGSIIFISTVIFVILYLTKTGPVQFWPTWAWPWEFYNMTVIDERTNITSVELIGPGISVLLPLSWGFSIGVIVVIIAMIVGCFCVSGCTDNYKIRKAYMMRQ